MMSQVDNRVAFRPAGWSSVSGGIGVFNVSLGWIQPVFPIHYQYVSNILQDTTISVATDPISQQCKSRDTCESYLLTGGLKSISPWPYMQQNDSSLTAYMLKDIPVYQIETWETTFDRSLSWADSQCKVYASGDDGLRICVKIDENSGALVAGEFSCL
jgi:hypothetical protein